VVTCRDIVLAYGQRRFVDITRTNPQVIVIVIIVKWCVLRPIKKIMMKLFISDYVSYGLRPPGLSVCVRPMTVRLPACVSQKVGAYIYVSISSDKRIFTIGRDFTCI